ncbi:5'-nucleotidase C-terminal domain-containing protein, partial [Kibdelosporangium lantanae]
TASNNAVIAITNPGGIRADLVFASSPAGEGNGVVTYGEAFTVQPFSNIMQTITLTGTNLKNVLEQQWGQPGGTKMLQISSSLHYSWSDSAPVGSKVSNITVGGTPVDPNGSYRVSVNNFLAAGGDGFAEFKQGTNLAGGPVDLPSVRRILNAERRRGWAVEDGYVTEGYASVAAPVFDHGHRPIAAVSATFRHACDPECGETWPDLATEVQKVAAEMTTRVGGS